MSNGRRESGKVRRSAPCMVAVIFGALLGMSGCAHLHPGPAVPPVDPAVPVEHQKAVLPTYRIEPPDVLNITAVNVLPKINPKDIVLIQFPTQQLSMEEMEALTKLNLLLNITATVDDKGNITIPDPYDQVINVYQMTEQQAEIEIAKELKKKVNPALVDKGRVKVQLLKSKGFQPVQGPHLVGPDGTINLGIYGSIMVTGMTVDEVKQRIEERLSQFLVDPEVAVAVSGYNSKVYYVIFDGGGFAGEQVIPLPVTGNETVLDAVGQVNGLPTQASRSHVWLARPLPGGEHSEVLPVDWYGITQRGLTKTNYQMLPGDRLYVRADPLLTVYNAIDRFIQPVERVMGATLLGASTYSTFRFINRQNFGFFGTGAGGFIP